MELIGRIFFLTLFVVVVAFASVVIPLPSASAPLIADHTVVEKYKDIPQFWIDEVKKMWVNVPGESHSYGYRYGLELLKNLDPRFQANRTEDGTLPEAYTDQHLRISGHRWNWGSWSYGAGEQNWYTNADGIANIKAHLTYSNTNNLAIAAMGFGWCWDMIWHNPPGGGLDPVYQVHWAGASVGGPQGDLRWGLDADDQALTGNSVSMDTYLNATQQYMDYSKANNYPTKVFFTTGPVDDSSGEYGYQLHLKQTRIRDYVNANDGILFDYADILTWGDVGTEATNSWIDYGGTLRVFPTIHPDNKLDLSGGYTIDAGHIGQRGALRLGKAMWWMLARIAGWDGVPVGGDNIPPTVTSTNPPINQTGVAVNTSATATFSEAIDPLTVTTATFTLKNGGATVSGVVSTSGGNATFTPLAPLAYSTTYTASLTTGIKDLAGNALASAYSWTFTTGTAPDTTPPTILSTSPAPNATGVPTGAAVTATFSENLDTSTITTATFTLKSPANTTVAGVVTYTGTTATFTPTAPLADNTTYTAELNTGIKDAAGNALTRIYTMSFTTAAPSSGSGGGSIDLTNASSGGGGCAAVPGSTNPVDFSGVFGTLVYASLVFFLRARRKSKRV